LLLLGHRFRERGVRAAADIPDNLPRVMGSESRLKQLFVNLLANAADAAGGNVHIAAAPCENGQYLEAVVEDDGPGIPDDVRKQMFNPFFTTKAGRLNTGLGLAICQQIIDAPNGLLLVERRGGRTVFSLRFPVCRNMPERGGAQRGGAC
ncbi:MAG: HAMP domain-containing histidine kinase, partial [Planctomycetota bacterium]|jgi:signal transduction histidine kinase|nr:HAMP domain-containing histidine kinase [Planctomycetota bacterium]